MKIDFLHTEKSSWGDKQHEISNQIVQCLKTGKEWGVEFYEIKAKKTNEQLRAIYQLLNLIKPHFDKWKKGNYQIEHIKDYVKVELDFMREPNQFEIKLMIKSTGFNTQNKEEMKKLWKFCKRIKQKKSFTDSKKDELIEFIEKLQVWAQTEDKEKQKTAWSDVYLEEKNINKS